MIEWLVYALLAAVTAALVAIFGKVGLQHIDTGVATAIRAVIMALVLFLVVMAQGMLREIPSAVQDSKALTFIVLSGVAGAASWLCYFLALRAGKVSQVAPIDRLSIIFAIILAALFLNEKVTWMTGLGTALIATGAIMIALG